MKILLDECITKQLKRYLTEYEVYTLWELNLVGMKNGKLMNFCAENRFDILLTIDKNLLYQQNIEKYPVTIAVLNSRSSKIESLIEFLPSFKSQANKLMKSRAYIIEK